MQKIKIFIIDDSILVRTTLIKIFSRVTDMEVIGSSENPVDAFEVFKKTGLPDVFILDIEMPKMDGLTFLQMLAKQKPIPTIICSSLVKEGSPAAIDAMRMGAVDVVLKPSANRNLLFDEMKEELLAKVRATAKSHVSYMANAEQQNINKTRKTRLALSKNIIAIGSSTGGVQVLETILSQLEEKHPPIVITQHMPVGFTASFSKRLDQILQYSHVKEAEEGDVLMHGRILIAPGDLHMEVKKHGFEYKITLKNFPKVNSHKPSVNVLFRSMAKEVGKRGIGFILTGMGDDGVKGLLEMKEAGAATFAQEEKSCIVYGMPKQAVLLGAVTKSLSLQSIAKIINEGV